MCHLDKTVFTMGSPVKVSVEFRSDKSSDVKLWVNLCVLRVRRYVYLYSVGYIDIVSTISLPQIQPDHS